MDHDTDGPTAASDPESADPLTELLHRGARDLLKQAVEAELQAFLDQTADQTLDDGRRAVVRNGHQPEAHGADGHRRVSVQMPKTRDRSSAGLHFTSNLLPPHLRKTCSVEELLS